MSQALHELDEYEIDWRAISADIITEDDEPVDNFFSAKQQRLLVEPLYSSWQPQPDESGAPRKFLADANVGIFSSRRSAPIVPDMFLSLDIEPNPEWIADEHRSYFLWEYGKSPEIAVEIVSNRKGGETTRKVNNRYAQIDVGYYVVFDPFRALGDTVLTVYERGLWKRYQTRGDFQLPEVGLSLKLWNGEFEGFTEEWLRWCDADGNLILTGAERAKLETERAEVQTQRADNEAQRADNEAQRADVEAAARQAAERELEQLRRELERLQNK